MRESNVAQTKKMKIKQYLKKLKGSLGTFLKDPLFLRHWERDYDYGRRYENRLSIRTLGQRGRTPYPYHGDSFMFVEDMYLGVTPLSSERNRYPTSLDPPSPAKETLIAEGISGRGYRHSLADGLFDFVRMATMTLFQEGVALYEIVYKKNTVGEIESFSLEWIQPFYLFKFFKNYYQFISWREARESHLRVQIIKIPEDKVLRIDFPNKFGGRRKIRHVLKRLYRLSKDIMPKFYMDAMEKNEDIGFDFNEFVRAKYLEVARLTNHFGWNQRKLSGNDVTEYYSMVRYLREKRVQITIRDEVVSRLNEILGGPVLNMGVKIITENFLTIADVERQEKSLQDGDVAFVDIFNATKI